jgi:hypothetical protein
VLEDVMSDPRASITKDRGKNEEPQRKNKRENNVDEHEARANNMEKAASIC